MSRAVKYNNQKTRCLCGHVHDSRGEAGYCDQLLDQQKRGEILSYSIQAIFVLAGGIKHKVDFYVLPKSTMMWEVHEFKGYKTAVWRMKEKLFREKFPGIPYRVITNERRSTCRKRRLAGSKKILKRIKVWR